MHTLLFEDEGYLDLLPLTFTRPAATLRIGIDTIQEKWSAALANTPALLTRALLKPLFERLTPNQNYQCFNGRYLPDAAWLAPLRALLKPGIGLVDGENNLIAFEAPAKDLAGIEEELSPEVAELFLKLERWDFPVEPLLLRHATDLFRLNGQVLRQDFVRLTAGRKSHPIVDNYTVIYNKEQVFVEEGVVTHAAVLNAEEGPIYLAAHSEVQEGAVLRGAHSIGAHSMIAVGAKLRGDTTIGPYCKVGGEVANSLLQGYSNKGHDGFLGNSVLGYWCNLGAGTNTSNLKNTYAPIALHSYRTGLLTATGLTFCGLLMGDHGKSAIGSQFNSGTVVGVSANVFGVGLLPKHVPSFSWGTGLEAEPYRLPQALEVAARVMARRQVALTELEVALLTALYQLTVG